MQDDGLHGGGTQGNSAYNCDIHTLNVSVLFC